MTQIAKIVTAEREAALEQFAKMVSIERRETLNQVLEGIARKRKALKDDLSHEQNGLFTRTRTEIEELINFAFWRITGLILILLIGAAIASFTYRYLARKYLA